MKYRLEMFTGFIIIIALLQITGITYYPVWLWALAMSGMGWMLAIITKARRRTESQKPPVTVLENHTVDNILWSIYIDRSGKRLLQMAYHDDKGDHFYSILLTMKEYKALKRGKTDTKTLFNNPHTGLIIYTHNDKIKWSKQCPEIKPGINPFKEKKYHRKERTKLQRIFNYFWGE